MPRDKMKDLKNYRIMVLGASASGKTVLLASMFKRLGIQNNEDTGFFLNAEDEQRKRLNYLNALIEDPHKDWPPGTDRSEVSEWRFTCCVQSSDLTIYEVLHFTYLDYSGGQITDPIPAGVSSRQFNKALKSADVLMGLLDGQKILEFMAGNKAGFRLDVVNILQMMQNSTKPIHFIITKWDLLEEQPYSLGDILAEMDRSIEEFHQLISNRTKNAPQASIRVIPVSAVGKEFIELQTDSKGEKVMQKKEGKSPKPSGVEMPLVCVLPDKFADRYRVVVQLEEDERRSHARKGKHYVTVEQALAALVTVGHWPVSGLLRVFAKRNIVEAERNIYRNILSSFRKGAEAKRIQEEKSVQDALDESLKPIKDQETALEHTTNRFLKLVGDLERKYPESLLSR